MKTNTKFICTALMLLLPLTVFAQKSIDEAFERIQKTNGIKSSVTNFHNETNGIHARTTIIDILVDKQNFKLFDDLRDAFQSESSKAYMDWSFYEPIAENNTRKLFRINQAMGSDDILVGNEKKSSFVVMMFQDPENKECRTVYSAEWWETEDPDIQQGRLVCSYGEKPKAQTKVTRTYRFNIPEGMNADSIMASYRSFPDSIMASYRLLPDSLMAKGWKYSPQQIDSLMGGKSRPFGNFRRYEDSFNGDVFGTFPDDSFFFHGNDRDMALTGNINGWVSNAVSKIGKLSPSDWLRLFGLLTEKMDKLRNNPEELIVSAGLVLDLCKNVPKKLEEDEREICANRLTMLARSLQKTNEYVHALLLLAANKVTP